MSDFNEIWENFHGQLLSYIKGHVSNPHDAEDILQKVFIKIFKNIDDLENPQAIKGWIYKITKNTILDFYKKKKDVSVAPESLKEIENEDDFEDNMNDEISLCVEKMLFSIPEKYQEVYKLYEKEEMKHKEIAETLDISVSASKVRLKRAKDMFKIQLLECCDFEVDQYGNIIDYTQKKPCENCNGKC